MQIVQPTIDVCVASYKRPQQLETLLHSLVTQETDGEIRFRIVVADNDAARTAEPVVRAFAASGIELRYDVEPRQSISLARNKALSLASAGLIATTDDDLYVEPRWLLTLYRAMTAYDADVVHGPVIPEFPPRTPAWICDCPIFNRPNPPTGSTDGYVYSTANALFRRSLIADRATPFDPRFGRTGGEDSAFFNGLRDRGARMVWCREAQVIGPVSPARANLRWLLQRRFRYGNLHPLNGVRPTRPSDVAAVGTEAVKHTLAAPLYLAAGLVARRHRDRGMKALLALLLHAAFVLGVVSHYVGYVYEEYRPR
ncbi:MAG TPA: glycosyltransferase [Candidatus Binatia bacterium]